MNATPIYNARGELIAGFVAFPDITERKWAEFLRQIYAARLERSNRDLQDFASSASHDLQEPLRKIRMFGERLTTRANTGLTAEARDWIARMINAAARMQAMIDALLDYSRVTTKAQPFAQVDLAQVAAEAVADLEASLEQTGGRVELGELPWLEADALQMRLLLQNLIGNALKFHRPGVPPVVKVWGQALSSSQVQIRVADNGIGVDAPDLPRLFRPFERLNGRSEYEGSGMGLAICRKIVERHEGTITAQRAPEGGAVFIITLPYWQPKGPAPL
jgi:signal transduction histidine kinase